MANVWIIVDHDVDVAKQVRVNGADVTLAEMFSFSDDHSPAPTIEIRRARSTDKLPDRKAP